LIQINTQNNNNLSNLIINNIEPTDKIDTFVIKEKIKLHNENVKKRKVNKTKIKKYFILVFSIQYK
jgi:hypothetical protein